MAWSSHGTCHKCGKEGRVFPAFGKSICKACKDSRPNKGKGNAGMIATGQIGMCFDEELTLNRVRKSDPTFGAMFFRHYPGSKGIPGRSLNYLIAYRGQNVGIIGFNSPPRHYGLFSAFFGENVEESYLVNNVFRIEDTEKNLATRVMAIARRRVLQDYKDKYGQELLGLCTFVEPPRTGALYKADNWKLIGESQGIRMRRNSQTWEKEFSTGHSRKLVFAYRYKKGKT